MFADIRQRQSQITAASPAARIRHKRTILMATTSAQKPLVIITGAAGNLGQTLAQALGNEYHIIGLDRSSADSVDANYTVDVTESASVKNAFEQLAHDHGRAIAAVIHLAAYFDFTGDESPLYQKVN